MKLKEYHHQQKKQILIVQKAIGGLNRKYFPGLDLSGRDFSGENLSEADFRLSRLNGIKLEGAELSGARFFLCSGLTKEQHRYLIQKGAKARFLLSPVKISLLLAIPLVLMVLLYHTATGINFISNPTLKESIKQAKAQNHYQRALKYNQVLIKRSSQNPSSEVFFQAVLEAAKINGKLNRQETALKHLQELYTNSQLDLDQKARVCNELARSYLAKQEPNTALGYIKDIDRSKIKQETLYMVEMSYALILRRQKDFAGALAVYQSLLPLIKNNPAQVKVVKDRINNIANRIK